MDRIRIGYSAGYLRFFRIRIGFGYSFLEKNWIRPGSGYWFDFYNEIFPRVAQDVINDGGSIFLLWFSNCQYVLHSSQSVVIRLALSLIFSSQVEVVSCSAALFVVLNGICVCCAG